MTLDTLRDRLLALFDRHGVSAGERGEALGLLEAARREATLTPVSTAAERGALLPEAASAFGPQGLPVRYEVLGDIGRGGMGEVLRVYDRLLGRAMAAKIIRGDLRADAQAAARFIEEAQATAQLQHPGIVPVHDLGRMADGRCFFTMKEVTGRTLHSVLTEVHRAVDGGKWGVGETGWTFRRLVDVFQRVCEAVGYAHARGVVHRDLKPSNILVGDFGEVIVVDWGLARVKGHLDRALAEGELSPEPQGPVITERSRQGLVSRRGRVAGTPAYMSPEQAAGEVERMGPATDVYALGAILYELLSGRPPYLGADAREVLGRVRQGAAPPPSLDVGAAADTWEEAESDPRRSPSPASAPPPLEAGELIPEALRALCQWAMARDPADRPASAEVLAAEVGGWLDGARRREAALAVVERARALIPRMDGLSGEAARLGEEAAEALAAVEGWRPVAAKEPGWAMEDRGEALRRELDVLEVRYLQLLRGALTHDPELPEAHALLAEHYHRRHRDAEAALDERAAAHQELLLRDHDRAGAFAAWLDGGGSVTVVTDPPGATARLARFVEERRYLVPQDPGPLGETPIQAAPLGMGSYVLTLSAPGRAEVAYPVFIDRQGRWDGVRPGERDPTPIALPEAGSLGADEVFIPPGWFWSGGDPQAQGALPRQRIWVDGFVIQRFPVTNRQYLAFLNDLVDQGREAEAQGWAPRDRGGAAAGDGDPIYGRDRAGRFTLRVDDAGVPWSPDWPVVMIDWASARAYARWYGGRVGDARWRLPFELEWEKAARGVDGRAFPWGPRADPTFACVHPSHRGRPQPPPVDSFPLDTSVYGVRGVAGNVGDWCLDAYLRDGPPLREGGLFEGALALVEGPFPLRVYRGGSWISPLRFSRVAFRYGYAPDSRYANLGMRLARPAP